MSVRSSILAAAAVAASLCNLAAAPAFAESPESILVSYADLNLANAAGRDILDRRIANAASSLCGQYTLAHVGFATAARACQAETIAAVQPQRDAAMNFRGTVRVSSADRFLRVSRAAS